MLGILLLTWSLLVSSGQRRSLWVDELFSVRVASAPTSGEVVQGVMLRERRPPGYHLAVHYWLRLVGDHDVGLRVMSISAATIAIALTFQLGRMVGGWRTGLLAALLLAASPFLFLFGPMVRYYSLTMVLGSASTLVFLCLPICPHQTSLWIGYWLSSAALVAVDYPALALLLIQNLVFLWRWQRYRSLLRRWIIVQLLLAAETLLWLHSALIQAGRNLIEADLARGALGFMLKLLYPLYSFSVGETIFPWRPMALLGLTVMALFFLNGCRQRGEHVTSPRTLVPFALLPVLTTALILYFISTDITFLGMGSRSAFAVPFFYTVVAAGAVSSPQGQESHPERFYWRLAGVALLMVVFAIADANAWAGREYHNPIYAVPTREIAAYVSANARPEDVVISDPDVGFDRYYDRTGARPLHYFSNELTCDELEGLEAKRVWLLTFGRDRTRLVDPAREMVTCLEKRYELVKTRGYVPQDPIYSAIKARLLHRANYRYKALLRLYARRE